MICMGMTSMGMIRVAMTRIAMTRISGLLPALLAAVLFTGGLRAEETEGGPLVEPVDLNEVHSTWRNLANEQVVFPLDMSDMPVKIGRERQLFLDNYLIAESRHVTRRVNPPRRFEGNPVLAPPKDESCHIVVKHVLQFDTPPRFRMWYWPHQVWRVLPSGQRIRFATSYATSEDGIHWERPNLNLYKDAGLAHGHNVVLPYGLMQGLFYEPDEPDPQKRFKALVCVERKNPTVREGYYVHTSPDGIHWTGDLSHDVIPSLTGYDIPQNGIGDTTRFWRDPLRGKYIGDVKFVLPGKLRSRGIMESDDLTHWTRPHPTFFARAAGAQIYGHRGFAYQGMYVGMRWIFLPEYSRRHSSYVELDSSRDGRIWTRSAAGQSFMAFNPDHDTWDASIMRPVSMLEVGDEIWIYYFAAPSQLETDNPSLPEAQRTDYAVGLATLPRDRFVSITAGPRLGTVVTRPLDFEGKTLHVNAQIAEGGKLTVAVLTRDGDPIDRFDHKDFRPLTGDGIDLSAAWRRRADLAGLQNASVRLAFRLDKAKLYSFWID